MDAVRNKVQFFLVLIILSFGTFASAVVLGQVLPPPTIDGKASNSCNLCSSLTATLSTSGTSDVIIVAGGLNTARNGASDCNVPTSPHLNFMSRFDSTSSSNVRVCEYFAVTSLQLSSEVVAFSTTGGTALNLIVFGVSGADTVTPFDLGSGVGTWQGTWGSLHSSPTFSTTGSNGLVVESDAVEGDPTFVPGTCGPVASSTLLDALVSSWDALHVEVGTSSSTLSGVSCSDTLSVGNTGATSIDVIRPAPSVSTTSTTSTSSSTSSTSTTTAPPRVEGSASNSCNLCSSLSGTLKTSGTSEVIIVVEGLNTARNGPADCGTPTSTHLSFNLRFDGLNSNLRLCEYYATTSSPLASEQIMMTSTSATAVNLIILGVTGADISAPFDSGSGVGTWQGTWGTSHSSPTFSTSSANALLIESDSVEGDSPFGPGNCGTVLSSTILDSQVPSWAALHTESAPVSSAQGGITCSNSLSVGNSGMTSDDAIRAGGSPGLHGTTTGVTPSLASSVPGGSTTFTATVVDSALSPTTPTGKVSWADGGAGGSFGAVSYTHLTLPTISSE